MSDVEVTSEGLVYHQQIRVPYRYTAGRAHRAFLRGLQQRRIVASRHGDEVYAPARPFAPDGTPMSELTEVCDTGEVVGWTVVARDPEPVVYGLVRLDGATSPMLHLLDVPAEQLAAGLRVRARWRPDPEASITAIEAFEAG